MYLTRAGIETAKSFYRHFWQLRQQNFAYLDWKVKYQPELAQFKDIHQGKDCFIIGNGPSLNKTDLSLLKGYYVFGLNKIHLIFEKYSFDLTYHVVINPFVIQQIKSDLDDNLFKCPSFLSYHASRGVGYKNKNVYRLHTRNKWSFYKDINEPICEGYTVTYVAMMLAYYMGFKNVFLVGVDHNYKQVGKPNEEQVHIEDDPNHFHPDYFKGQKWHLADVEANEASYALAKHQFHMDGRNIYDATVEGKLDVFEKVSFAEALTVAKKI